MTEITLKYASEVEDVVSHFKCTFKRFIGTSYITDNSHLFEHLFSELDRGFMMVNPESNSSLLNGTGLLWYHIDLYCSIKAMPKVEVIEEITNILYKLAQEKNLY